VLAVAAGQNVQTSRRTLQSSQQGNFLSKIFADQPIGRESARWTGEGQAGHFRILDLLMRPSAENRPGEIQFLNERAVPVFARGTKDILISPNAGKHVRKWRGTVGRSEEPQLRA
jgi:hypothetical protein